MAFQPRVGCTVGIPTNCFFVVAVPRTALTTGSTKLSAHVKKPDVTDRVNSVYLITTLSTLHHVLSKPILGMTQADKNKEVNVDLNCFKDSDGRHKPCIRAYCEFIYGPWVNGVRGPWVGNRFWYLKCDPAFGLELGIYTHFKNEEAKKKKVRYIPEKNPLPQWKSCKEYIEFGANSYSGQRLFNTEAGNKANALFLYDAGNPAAATEIFTFERSCEIFAGIADQRYLNEANYFGVPQALEVEAGHDYVEVPQAIQVPDAFGFEEDEEEEDEEEGAPPAPLAAPLPVIKIFFPEGAHPLEQQTLDPKIFLNIDISIEPELVVGAESIESIQRRQAQLLEIGNADQESYLEQCLARNKVRALHPGYDNWRKSYAGIEELKSLIKNDERNQGGRLAADWFEKVQQEEPNFSTCPVPMNLMDSSLSYFDNFKARDIYNIETTCGRFTIRILSLLILY